MKPVPLNRYLLFGFIVGAGFCWDLYSKDVVFADLGYPAGNVELLTPGEHVLFAQPAGREGESEAYLTGWTTFRLYTSFNEGALWGVGQGYTWLFASLSVLAVVGVVYWMFVVGAAESIWLTISLAAIMAGTLGNLYDRLGMHGYVDLDGEPIRAVRDFLLFTFGEFSWPVFNFADCCLVTGAVMLILQSLVGEAGGEPDGQGDSQDHHEPAAAEADAVERPEFSHSEPRQQQT